MALAALCACPAVGALTVNRMMFEAGFVTVSDDCKLETVVAG